MPKKKNGDWGNRIVSDGFEDPAQLIANPWNFRIHNTLQQNAALGSLETLGWVQRVLVNKNTNHVVDGHLRILLAMKNGQTKVPISYLDLTEEEEKQALASLDPIAALASTDKEKLGALLDMVNSDNQLVQSFFESLAVKENIIPPVDYDKEWQEMPEFANDEVAGAKTIIVHFETIEDYWDFTRLIGQPTLTEKTKSTWHPFKKHANLKDVSCTYDPEP